MHRVVEHIVQHRNYVFFTYLLRTTHRNYDFFTYLFTSAVTSIKQVIFAMVGCFICQQN